MSIQIDANGKGSKIKVGDITVSSDGNINIGNANVLRGVNIGTNIGTVVNNVGKTAGTSGNGSYDSVNRLGVNGHKIEFKGNRLYVDGNLVTRWLPQWYRYNISASPALTIIVNNKVYYEDGKSYEFGYDMDKKDIDSNKSEPKVEEVEEPDDVRHESYFDSIHNSMKEFKRVESEQEELDDNNDEDNDFDDKKDIKSTKKKKGLLRRLFGRGL